MKRMTFHSGTDTAREPFEHILVLVLNSASDIDHVTSAAIFGINRGEDMIEQCALVKLRIFDVRVKGEESPSHLEHVIDVAGFCRAAINSLAEFVGFAEIFVFAMSAGRIAVVLGDAVPEKPGGEAVAGIACINVTRE